MSFDYEIVKKHYLFFNNIFREQFRSLQLCQLVNMLFQNPKIPILLNNSTSSDMKARGGFQKFVSFHQKTFFSMLCTTHHQVVIHSRNPQTICNFYSFHALVYFQFLIGKHHIVDFFSTVPAVAISIERPERSTSLTI